MKNKHLYILTFLLFFIAIYSHAQITETQLLERFENPLFDPSVEEPITAASLILDSLDLAKICSLILIDSIRISVIPTRP